MLAFDDPLPTPARRILVAGVSGAGKTTLARRIEAVSGIPHTEIDALYHGAGWVPRPRFLEDVRALADTGRWVTEWQYDLARPVLARCADLLVWLDLPFWPLVFPRVVRRTLSRSIRGENLWNGNREPPLRTIVTDRDHIVRWSMRTRHRVRDEITGLATEHPRLPIVRLRTAREVNRWVRATLPAAYGAPENRRSG